MTTPPDAQLFDDTPEQAQFRTQVRAFLEANAEPKQKGSPWRLTFHTNGDDARRDFEIGRAWQQKRFEAGLTGFTYPKEYGGQDGEAWQERIYNEEARLFSATSGFVGSSIQMLGPTLMAYGTEEQKRDVLPRLLSAEDSWCQLFSEPGSGSDLASLGCRAIRDGDEFVVSGQKVWNSAAQWCDHGFLLVRTSPDKPKHQGITFLLIDMDAPGVDVRPLVQATGAAHFNEVFLDAVRVPVSRVLGEIDGGWAVARTVMANESAMIGGSGNKSFPVLRQLAEAFDKTSDPMVRQSLADFYTRERVLDVMSDRIMTAIRRREKPPVDPSILKLFMTANRVLSGSLATSIAGVHAIAGDDPMTRWVAAEVVGRYSISIGGGTTEVQKNNLAERALGLPRDVGFSRDTPWSDIPRS